MDVTPLPAQPDLEQYWQLARDLVRAAGAGDLDAQRRLRSRRSGGNEDLRGGRRGPTLADARQAIAAEHGFGSWTAFAKHLDALAVPDSPAAQFESSADAIVDGNLSRLDALLANPGLARARSDRIHRATLLHYVAANGVEDYRQRTPSNAVAIAGRVLAAGADVDAAADMYGGLSTTLGLVASSVHPARAGVQTALIETLIDAGAAVDGLAGGWTPLMAALAHGHAGAVRALVGRGARIDNVATAAGAGRLDVLEALLETGVDAPRGSEAVAGDAPAQLSLALNWAALFGHDDVIDHLLDRGQAADALDGSGQGPLHLAVHAGHLSTIDLLVRRGAPLEGRNVHGGTALGQAVWSALNEGPGNYPEVIERLLDAGADVGAAPFPTGIAAIDTVLERRGRRR